MENTLKVMREEDVKKGTIWVDDKGNFALVLLVYTADNRRPWLKYAHDGIVIEEDSILTFLNAFTPVQNNVVYLVEVSYGSYDDHTSWIEAIYDNFAAAKEHMYKTHKTYHKKDKEYNYTQVLSYGLSTLVSEGFENRQRLDNSVAIIRQGEKAPNEKLDVTKLSDTELNSEWLLRGFSTEYSRAKEILAEMTARLDRKLANK